MRHDPSAPSVSALLAPMRRAVVLACALAGTACAPLPDAPSDAGDALADAGEALPDAGEALPDAGEALPDAGDPLPDGGEVVSADLEVIGQWADNWGGELVITEESWGSSAIVKFDNAANWAVTQHPADDPWNPGKFAKQVWTEPADGSWWACTIEFAADTADAAEHTTKLADPTTPATSGCGGFGWTRMEVPLEVRGTWVDSYGFDHAFSNVSWDGARVVKVDNAANVVIAQAPADDPWNRLKFSKQVWTDLADGAFWQCTIEFAADSAEAAENTAKVADPTTPATSGCGGFGWTRMEVPLEVRGAWMDDYGFDHEFSNALWDGARVVKLDNAANVVIAQAPASDPWNPLKFSKQVWTDLADGSFWQCTVEFAAETQAAAEATTTVADPTDPAASGCGGFSWSRMTPALELRGTWDFGDGAAVELKSAGWGTLAIVSFDNAANLAIVRYPATHATLPGRFARYAWTEPASDAFHLCVTGDGADTADAARASTDVANAADLATGCRGEAWTLVTKATP